MATVNSQNIFVGAPLQSVTGAVFTAPVGTTLPTDATTELDQAFTSSGYVSEDGVSLEPERSTTNIRDWSHTVVRTLVDETSATVSFSLLELSEEGLKQAFGDGKVTKTEANSSHGVQLAISVDAEMPDAKAWVFNMKDGDRRVRLVIPNGQVTSLPSMTFAAGEAITVPVDIVCNPDSSGVIYAIYTDDGQKTV